MWVAQHCSVLCFHEHCNKMFAFMYVEINFVSIFVFFRVLAMHLSELWLFIFPNTRASHLLKWSEEQTRLQLFQCVALVHKPATQPSQNYRLHYLTRLALTHARNAAPNPTRRSYILGVSRKREGQLACRMIISRRVTASTGTRTSHLRKASEGRVMTMRPRIRRRPEGFSPGAEAKVR